MKANAGAVETTGARIKNIRKKKKLTQQELANRINAHRVTVQTWENSSKVPNSTTLQAIASSLETTVAYLIGETHDPEPQRQIYFGDAELKQKEVNVVRFDQNAGIPLLPYKLIPVLDQEACAGKGFDYDDLIAEAKEWIPWPLREMGGPVDPKGPFFVPVEGDSMIGADILDGDLVLINQNLEVLNGDSVYIEWRGMRSIKGFVQYSDGRIELRPANSNYQIIYLSAEEALSEEFRVVGKVVRCVNMRTPKKVV